VKGRAAHPALRIYADAGISPGRVVDATAFTCLPGPPAARSSKLHEINVFSYQHGIYPRSEQVVAATRGLDRGRVSAADVDQAFAADLAAFIRAQQRAGLDFFSDGLLRWQDIFRPLTEALGVKPHTLVRWFDTNTFFREPVLDGAFGPVKPAGALLPVSSVPAPRVATLPSPYMFSRVAHTGEDRNRLMVDLAEKVLAPVIRATVEADTRIIHLEDPWLGYRGIERGDWAPLNDALQRLRHGPATLVYHVYFGDTAPHLDLLRRLPVDAIGVDLIETDLHALGSGWDKGLVAGIVNGRSSNLESLAETVEVAQRIAETVRPKDLYLSSNCELGFLPTVVAERKLQRLGEVSAKVKGLVSV
jgi:5-methyltetrahydropteroyltriglutamate--homocysteine methyltransferase